MKDGKKLRLEELPAQRAARGEPVRDFEFSIVFQDGAVREVLGYGTPLLDAAGKPRGAVHILVDITERKQVAEALRQAHEQLENHALHLEKLVVQRTARLNEMVSDLEAFSYSMIHDIRAPLRAMQSYAQLLAEECAPQAENAELYLRRIMTAGQRMDQLIQDGLNFSRLMKEQLPLRPTSIEILLRGILETYPAFQPPLANVLLEGSFPIINGNESALTQCFSNLIGNAVKFVSPGITPHVRIWAESSGSRVRFSVKDNGIGIEKAAHERIFDIFFRLDPRYEGTGIGLAIVKKAVERMAGTLGVQSEPGNGSTFWIELPLANDEPRTDRRDNFSP
jgi:signal transduction histidine kinase